MHVICLKQTVELHQDDLEISLIVLNYTIQKLGEFDCSIPSLFAR